MATRRVTNTTPKPVSRIKVINHPTVEMGDWKFRLDDEGEICIEDTSRYNEIYLNMDDAKDFLEALTKFIELRS